VNGPRPLFVEERSDPTQMAYPEQSEGSPPVRLPSEVAPPRARGFQVFKDVDDRTGPKIARKDIWVGAVATRTVVRELFDIPSIFRGTVTNQWAKALG